MSALRVDTTFDYVAPNGRPGRCLLRLYDQGSGDVVLVATELGAENPGPSVTNAIEAIATTACRRYRLDPERLTVIEHADDRRTPGPPVRREDGERFDVVTFGRVPTRGSGGAGAASGGADAPAGEASEWRGTFAEPSWRRIRKRAAEALVGQPLP